MNFNELIEKCRPGTYLEIFARGKRTGWDTFGNQAEDYNIGWETYANNSREDKKEEHGVLQLALLEPIQSLKKAE